jgi:hypothetical protein
VDDIHRPSDPVALDDKHHQSDHGRDRRVDADDSRKWEEIKASSLRIPKHFSFQFLLKNYF